MSREEHVQTLFEDTVRQYINENFGHYDELDRAVFNLVWHRVQCIECTYNEYLCKDGQQEGLIEGIERAYLGDNIDHILYDVDNKVYEEES